MVNVEPDGIQLSLTFRTLCNAPILYDCRVGSHSLTFGSTGMLLERNKVMFDEETESLWSQYRGISIAGEFAEGKTVSSTSSRLRKPTGVTRRKPIPIHWRSTSTLGMTTITDSMTATSDSSVTTGRMRTLSNRA